jgi:pimeloyl-ACP methyl ester carboxylesterase
MMLRVSAAAVLAAGFLACSDDGDVLPVDAGAGDAADAADTGAIDPDAGPLDLGSEDVGPEDASGGQDPELIFRGTEPIDGQRLFIEARGTTTSTNNPVLFLAFEPGFGSDYLVPETRFLLGDPQDPDRALIYLDLLAQGRSSIADDSEDLISPISQMRSIGNALTFLRENFFDESTRFDVVGHGYGALMAVLFDARNPGVFERMVLVSPYPIDVQDWARWQSTFRSDPRFDGKALVDLEISPRCARDLDQCLIDQFWIYALPWVCEGNTQAFLDIQVNTADRAGQWFVERNLRNTSYDFSPDLLGVRAETTVITGDCDPIPESTFQTYTSSIAGAQRVRIPDSGFFPMTESPNTFRSLVRQALSPSTTP